MADEVIDARGLVRAFGSTLAVDDVDVTVRQGEIVGLVGPNGAGKTTLMRMLATLLPPTSGQARVFGLNILTDFLPVRRRLGYLPDFFNLHRDLTVRECLRFYAFAYGALQDHVDERVARALASAGLEAQGDARIQTLSRGMVQRLGVGVLLARDAELMILDEPASGLDPRARVHLRELIKAQAREGRTILISSHVLGDLADACTHLVIMDRGRVVAGGPVGDVLSQGSGRSVLFRVLGDTGVAAACLAEAGAFGINVCESGVRVAAADPAKVAAMNARLVRAGVEVVGIELEGGGIEDVFMRLTASGGEGSR